MNNYFFVIVAPSVIWSEETGPFNYSIIFLQKTAADWSFVVWKKFSLKLIFDETKFQQ